MKINTLTLRYARNSVDDLGTPLALGFGPVALPAFRVLRILLAVQELNGGIDQVQRQQRQARPTGGAPHA